MGGNLTVVSKGHRGSTFTFVLPCKVPIMEEPSNDPDSLANHHVGDLNGSFIFEPKFDAFNASSRVSEKPDSWSWKDHKSSEGVYVFVLEDVCMPVMNGLQAARLIRAFEESGYGDALMTANALAESAAECLASGMDSYMSKPVKFQKLKQCLQQYLPSQTVD
uniref:histidine kinase n=1 Tax=Ananas comosus var. bracteatus TaxID=296719 RepID=A0A6V7NX67_ANACO|nr:unnamed protein product [Ananas comosus var. bracteatus]